MECGRFYQRGVNNVPWERRSTRTNSTEFVSYSFVHVVTLKLYHKDQKTFCEDNKGCNICKGGFIE